MSNRIKRKHAKQQLRKKARLVTDPATGERWIEMDDEMAREMKAQLARFKEKFGREPGPNDPVFFDPDEDTPKPIPEWKIDQAFDEAIAKLPPEQQQAMREFAERVFPERKPAKTRKKDLQ
jgi:hypothetical protein